MSTQKRGNNQKQRIKISNLKSIVILIIFLSSLFARDVFGQKIPTNYLIGKWDGYWEVKDSTKKFPPGSLEIMDSTNAIWRLWNNEVSKFTYKLEYRHGGVTSSDMTFFSMSGLNYQNQYVNTFALLTKYGNDTLKIQWLTNPDKPIAQGDTSTFHNTVILIRERH